MELKKLPSDVVNKLRSGVAIASIAHCMEELVLNALDAGATAVAVRLNFPYHKVQVVDNGHGMTKEQLAACGERYSTSKCYSVADLEHPKFYGYRGEALASLAEMSGGLQVETRAATSDATYYKIFTQDFMYNLPVRRRCVSETIDFEFCLQHLEGIALSHPHVSFTLRDDITGEKRFQTHKTTSVLDTFALLFGRSIADSLKHVVHREKKLGIKAYLSTEGHSTKRLQFVYLNNRFLLKTRIHKIINNVLKKYVFRIKGSVLGSPTKLRNKHPIFIVFLKCSSRNYDVTFEPRKTMVEFVCWDAVTKSFECLLGSFLRENKIIDHDITISGDLVFGQRTGEKTEAGSPPVKATQQISIDDVRNALVSKKVSRCRISGTTENLDDPQRPHHEDVDVTGSQKEQTSSDEENEQISTSSTKGQHDTVPSDRGSRSGKQSLPRQSIVLPPSFSESSQKRGQLSLPNDNTMLIINKFLFQRKQPPTTKRPVTTNKHTAVKQLRPTSSLQRTDAPSKMTKVSENFTGLTRSEVDATLAEDAGKVGVCAESHEWNLPTEKHRLVPHDHIATRKQVTFTEPSPYFSPRAKERRFVLSTVRQHSVQATHLIATQHERNSREWQPRTFTPLSRRLRRKFDLNVPTQSADTMSDCQKHVDRRSHVCCPPEDFNSEDYSSRPPAGRGCTKDPFVRGARDVLPKPVTTGDGSEREHGEIPRKISRLENAESSRVSTESLDAVEVEEDASTSYPVLPVPETRNALSNHAPHAGRTQPFSITQGFEVRNASEPSDNYEINHELPSPLEPSHLPDTVTEVLAEETLSTASSAVPPVSTSVIPETARQASSSLERGSCEFRCGQAGTCTLPASNRHDSLPLSTLTFLRPRNSLSTKETSPGARSSQVPSSIREPHLKCAGTHSCQSNVSSGNEVESTSSTNRHGPAPNVEKLQTCTESLNSANVFETGTSSERDGSDVINFSLGAASHDGQRQNCASNENVEERVGDGGSVFCKRNAGPPEDICATRVVASNDGSSERDTENRTELAVTSCDSEGQKTSPGWVAWVDPVSGEQTYINLPSGNSSFLPPPCLGEQKAVASPPRFDFEPRAGILPWDDPAAPLPRPRAERPQFRCEPGPEQSSLMGLLKEWQNPVFTRNALQDISEGGLCQQNGAAASFGVRQSYKFTKQMLEHLKVIGQVDAKFIACLVPVYDNGMLKDDCLVVLFDQHAAHERVRLEQLLEGQYEGTGQARRIKSSSVTPRLQLQPEPDVLRRVAICQNELNRVGFHCVTEKSSVLVDRLPTCLVERDKSERYNGRLPTLARHAEEILVEYTATLVNTRKSAIALPKVLYEVLGSQACRGAIKFGNVLGISDCQKILLGLSTCNLPFQCAHGRPSVAPIVDLRYLEDTEVQKKPNLSRIREEIVRANTQASSDCVHQATPV